MLKHEQGSIDCIRASNEQYSTRAVVATRRLVFAKTSACEQQGRDTIEIIDDLAALHFMQQQHLRAQLETRQITPRYAGPVGNPPGLSTLVHVEHISRAVRFRASHRSQPS